MSNLAPVALFVYNRIEHVRKTLNSLSNNLYAEKSDLYIFSDGAKTSEDISLVNSVRKYCSSINNFKSTTLVKRDKNFGLAKNLVNGISQILEKNDKIIVLEDDLLTDKFFLIFMNDSLHFLKIKVCSINPAYLPFEKIFKPSFLKG